MKEIRFQTDCIADLRETWVAEVPDEIANGDEGALRDHLMAMLDDQRLCPSLVDEDVSNEHDRKFNRVLP